MNWTTKRRGDTGRPMLAEYECPVHGRFARQVSRDAGGDPEPEVPCRETEGEDIGGGFVRVNRCGRTSPHVISAPLVRVRRVEVARGGYQRAERPTWTDTTNLGEGQDLDDWKADRAKVWEADRQQQNKELA